MAGMNYYGTVDSDKVYTEGQLLLILHISQDLLSQYYQAGLRYCQVSTRKRCARLISGAEFHRFVERLSVPCPEGNDVEA